MGVNTNNSNGNRVVNANANTQSTNVATNTNESVNVNTNSRDGNTSSLPASLSDDFAKLSGVIGKFQFGDIWYTGRRISHEIEGTNFHRDVCARRTNTQT